MLSNYHKEEAMSLGSFIQEAKRWADQHRDSAVEHSEKNYKSLDEQNAYVQGHSDGYLCVVPPRKATQQAAYDQGYRDGQKASG
jgi:hypothetical protein